jgi:hypothetical protein
VSGLCQVRGQGQAPLQQLHFDNQFVNVHALLLPPHGALSILPDYASISRLTPFSIIFQGIREIGEIRGQILKPRIRQDKAG